MSEYGVVITQAGLNAAVTAGIEIKITHVGAGTTGYTPNRSRVALANEVSRVPVVGARKVSSTQWHLTADFSEGEFAAREVGFYLADGTLFAVWSSPVDVLFYKTELSRVVQAFDLILDALPADSVAIEAVGDLSFYYAEEFCDFAAAQIGNMTRNLELLFRIKQLEANI